MIKKIYFKIKQLFTTDKYWASRIKIVLESPDNEFIPRSLNAGKIINGMQIMHNNLKILKGSYYGAGITNLLKKNRGVHEPQEERIFGDVLKILGKSPTMIELGSYWGFYSMWFLKETDGGVVYLFEPDKNNLDFGIANFRLNDMNGDFNHALIGKDLDLSSSPPVFNIDFILKSKHIQFVEILHCDIQGHEYEMLLGASESLNQRNIGFIFISTHSNELHYRCISFLKELKYSIISECNPDESYSFDGLIVAQMTGLTSLTHIAISKRKAKI